MGLAVPISNSPEPERRLYLALSDVCLTLTDPLTVLGNSSPATVIAIACILSWLTVD